MDTLYFIGAVAIMGTLAYLKILPYIRVNRERQKRREEDTK